MNKLPEFANAPEMSKEMREHLMAAFEMLSGWRNELESVNERYLGKVLDQTSTLARSMGWSDQAVRATREYLDQSSKTQTSAIDQMMDAWRKKLKSPSAPLAVPSSFASLMPWASSSGDDATMNAFAPWTFWWHAAEMWQRAWMPPDAGKHVRPH